MQNKAVVCFIFPGITKSAEDPRQIVDRVNSYAARFVQHVGAGNSKAILISSGLPSDDVGSFQSDRNIQTCILDRHEINLIKFFIKSYKILKLEAGERITLIAGDNYGALLLCLALRKILRGHIRVQISIHGNPFSTHQRSMKALLRKLSFRILVPYASSIRLVSIHLRDELGTYFNREAEVVICPIPMTLPPLAHSRSRNGTVGVIGRLHDERGTGLLCEIITNFAESQNNLKFIVVGDGPQRSQLESIVLKFRDLNLKLLGSVSHAQVLGSYSNFDLLLSCAPSEGYGLALREAILSGIPVIAKENLGTLELKGSFPDMVFLYRSRNEAVELISSTLGFQPDLEIVENYRKKQVDFDESSILALVKSWS